VSFIAIADMFGSVDQRRALRDLLIAAEVEAGAIPGCARYTFTSTLADPDHIVLVSEWRDRAAMEAHYESDAFARFQDSLHGMLVRQSEMTIHEIAGSSHPTPSGLMDPREAD